MRFRTRAIALFLVFVLAFPIVAFLTVQDSTLRQDARTSTVTYPNSDISSLWVRKNGSDPGFPFPYANQLPSYGMNYFGTNVLQVTWDYSLSEISSTLFPPGCQIYIQIDQDSGPGYAEIVADYAAFNDSRIKGMFIDDFKVGQQSPANMSAIYTAVHHNDAWLANDLTLGIIVYNRNYMIQTPYNWSSIAPYFDIIHFWYYPFTYQLLYLGFAGYEDDFMTLYNYFVISGIKDFWIGIYLHYYNLGDYPTNFTYEQMSIAGKLIQEGYASRYSLLENFWIRNNPETSILVKNFINNEFQRHYSTHWYYNTTITNFYSSGLPTTETLTSDIRPYESHYPLYTYYDNWTFHSNKLQYITITDFPELPQKWTIWNLRNGWWQRPFSEYPYTEMTFYLEPDQTYRLRLMPMTYAYKGDITISTPTIWENQQILLDGLVDVRGELTIRDCIVTVTNDGFNNSMYYHTYPHHGFEINSTNDVEFIIEDSIISPMWKAYPMRLNRTPGAGASQVFGIYDSVIACYSERFAPYGYITIVSSTFYQVQPIRTDFHTSVWLECPSRINELEFTDNLIWNYDTPGTIGVFIMPANLYSANKLTFKNNTIIGGAFGLWIDMAYSDNYITLGNLSSGPASNAGTFCTFRMDGTSNKYITVTTYDIRSWGIKGLNPASPVFHLYWPVFQNASYWINHDDDRVRWNVTNGQLYVNYGGPWDSEHDNFTITLYSMFSGQVEENFSGLVWLLILFLPAIAMNQAIPKYGYVAGVILMLLIIGIANMDRGFFFVTIMGLINVGILIYKEG